MHTGFRQDIHAPMKELFEVLAKPNQVEQGPPGFHFDEQIQIASSAVVTSRDRTENPNVTSAVTGRNS